MGFCTMWKQSCACRKELQQLLFAQFLGFSLTESPGAGPWGARGALSMGHLISLGAPQLLPFQDVSPRGGEAPALVLSVQVLH